ncbi:hypothetical protein MHB71_04785 [Paenibacillus sp. FSL H7-0940]|uniref:hypothetical protein n=1 Tax=Paenibacillus sp. FSL H7-0940 TaxID=2921443 RepID=UPI0030EECF43
MTQVYRNETLFADDGGLNVIADRDFRVFIGGNYAIGGHMYRVVAIVNGRVMIRSI